MLNRVEGLRLVAGFIFAPAIGVSVLLLTLIAHETVTPHGNASVGSLAAFGLIAAYVTYSATFIIGLPLFILFYYRRWFRPWQMATGGLLVGASVALLLGTYNRLGIMFCVVGVTTGLFFWLLVIFRNRALTASSRIDAPRTSRA